MSMATKKAVSSKAAPKKTDSKDAGTKSASKKAGARKSASKSSAETYSKPALRERIKAKVLAGTKGGRTGQWSARKAQLVAQEYAAKGGEYKQDRNSTQRSLQKWGEEQWHTADGKQAIQGKETHRYLPDAAWKQLPAAEREKTDRKKVAASKTGKQFVANTKAAADARRRAVKDKG
jgi:hypothetical protein